MTQSPTIDSAVKKAEEFEQKHYADTTPDGSAEELDASDFKKAGANAADSVASAAQSVKTAVFGEPKEEQTAADTATLSTEGDTASPEQPIVSAPATEAPAAAGTAERADGGPSLVSHIQEKTVETLDSLQKAVEPTPGTESADPEVNNFRDLVGEVFSNMKESIATDKQDKEDASAGVSQGKPLAASVAEPQLSIFAQVKAAGFLATNIFMPEAHAAGRSPGDKWEDAKEEARESGRQASQSTRDAASALGDKTRYTADRAADKTQGFFQQARDETEGAAQDAKERVRRASPGQQVRGAANEVEDLARNAKDRVVEDWRDVKRGTQRTLEDSSAARNYDARRTPLKEDKGFFGSIFGWGADDKAEDKAREAADRTREKAEAGKEQARGWFNSAADETQQRAEEAKDKTNSWFNSAADDTRDTAEKAKDKTNSWFNSAADDTRDTAEKAKSKTRGFFNRAGDEADRLGDKAADKVDRLSNRAYETKEDIKRSAQDKLDRAEDYLTADMTPENRVQDALSKGLIPLDTQTVLRSRYQRYER